VRAFINVISYSANSRH